MLGSLVVGAGMLVVTVLLYRVGVIRPEVTEKIRHGVVVTETTYSRLWGIPFMFPVVMALVGLMNAATGRSFGELSAGYDRLSGAGRFVVGVLVVGLGIGVIMGLAAIALVILL